MSRPPLQFVFIVLLVLAIYLAIDFSQRISTSMQLAALEKQYAAERLRLEQINRDLNEKKKQVNTAAFVEKYVRENWHWVTDTDTLVLTSAAPADPLRLRHCRRRRFPPIRRGGKPFLIRCAFYCPDEHPLDYRIRFTFD